MPCLCLAAPSTPPHGFKRETNREYQGNTSSKSAARPTEPETRGMPRHGHKHNRKTTVQTSTMQYLQEFLSNPCANPAQPSRNIKSLAVKYCATSVHNTPEECFEIENSRYKENCMVKRVRYLPDVRTPEESEDIETRSCEVAPHFCETVASNQAFGSSFTDVELLVQ